MVKKKRDHNNAHDPVADELIFDTADPIDQEIDDIEASIEEKLRHYKEKLHICQKERQEYLDGWQRAKADYLNSKRRMEEEREQDRTRNTARFIETLLPLCDSFEIALRSTVSESETKNEWRTGLEQVYQQLLTVMRTYHVDTLTPLGETFDPHRHEAVSELPVTDPAQHHIILNVLQNGYTIGEHLIRPATVVVGTHETKR